MTKLLRKSLKKRFVLTGDQERAVLKAQGGAVGDVASTGDN